MQCALFLTRIVTPPFVFAILLSLLVVTLKWLPIIGRVSEQVAVPPAHHRTYYSGCSAVGTAPDFSRRAATSHSPCCRWPMGPSRRRRGITTLYHGRQFEQDYIASARARHFGRAVMGAFCSSPRHPYRFHPRLDIASTFSIAFL